MPKRRFEAALVEFCAPTLMGLKPASLFYCQAESAEQLRGEAGRIGRELAPFGLTLRILREGPRTGAGLVYLYRADGLRQILSEPAARVFLEGMGYPPSAGSGALLEQLGRRLRAGREFPHEIGVFLGYPLEDVVGFIENRGRNYTCCGCWKAYGDPRAAEARFAGYRRCTALCKRRYQDGADLPQLIAAGS